jgi:hypothetical protein
VRIVLTCFHQSQVGRREASGRHRTVKRAESLVNGSFSSFAYTS